MGYLVDRFGSNPVRCQIIRGLIEYRKLLFDGGFRVGFQWLDGSFVENAELDRGRAPGDVDLVTFYHRPVRYQTDKALWIKDAATIFATYFNRTTTLANYKCDAFPIDLDQPTEGVIRDVAYWFSLFSHHKITNVWKGMLQLELINAESEYHDHLLLLRQAESKNA